MRSVIIGTGCCIPDHVVTNKAFERHQFFDPNGSKLYKKTEGIIEKFASITGIAERRYAAAEQNCSDLGVIAAQEAIGASGIDAETLDYIIVAHNFGDVAADSNRTSQVPSIASKIKAMLQIKNPGCVAYDLVFGCPGWIEAVIQANCFMQVGMAKRCLVIGCETLSRVIDPHDRDSMIFSDGAGAVILESASSQESGILSFKTKTFAADSSLLAMDTSFSPFTADSKDRYLKMNGRKVYEFALTHVPTLMKEVLDACGLGLTDIRKVLVHQANEKMDFAILERLAKIYHVDIPSNDLMPMTIGWLGNSSVATIPTLLDLIVRGRLSGHCVSPGDYVLMASVGAGMNVNALVYKF